MQQQQQQQGDAAGGGAELQLQIRGGKEEEEEEVLATWDCGSPLYDSFEVASLHYVLEKHTMVLPPFPEPAAVSSSRRRSQRRHHRGGAALPADMAKTGNLGAGAARRRKTTRGWRGSNYVLEEELYIVEVSTMYRYANAPCAFSELDRQQLSEFDESTINCMFGIIRYNL